MLGEYLNFIVSRSGANLPRTPPRPLSPAADFAASPCLACSLLTEARFSRSAPACLRREASQHPYNPSATTRAAGGAAGALAGPILIGCCCAALRRASVPTRWRVARDESFSSVDGFGVKEHLRFVIVLLVHISTGLFVDRVRRYRTGVCLFVS